MTAYISVLVCLVGAVAYCISGNAKVSELGRLAYFAGLFLFLAGVAGHTVKVLGG